MTWAWFRIAAASVVAVVALVLAVTDGDWSARDCEPTGHYRIPCS